MARYGIESKNKPSSERGEFLGHAYSLKEARELIEKDKFRRKALGFK